ncbi:peptidylprolyl isomerase [Candidatus Pelagibacter sp.]|nr:peptidylprolyl isomerase [Candidatus Pelagibacter sp.]
MNKIKYILFVILFFNINLSVYGSSIKIITKVDNEIITNIDIKNEKKYLLFLNPKLDQLNRDQINKLARNSIITEIIKKKELNKIYDTSKMGSFLDSIEQKFLKNKNINNKSDFIKMLKKRDLEYDNIINKLHVEALWNQLIYSKFSKNIRINEEKMRKNILIQFQNEKKKYEYDLSEILFTENVSENFDETLKKIEKSIINNGFENTANIFSISSTSKNGGLIGWVNELQISENLKKHIIKLKIGQISNPIKISGGYLIIKLNNKKEFKQEVDLENELNQLIAKETNRQLNTYSIIFYKKLKKNIKINEL